VTTCRGNPERRLFLPQCHPSATPPVDAGLLAE
jgi:hypothetical protein